VRSLSPGNLQVQQVIRSAYVKGRKLNQGNADPGVLGNDFAVFGLELWTTLNVRYPSRASGWNRKLASLNTARNGIVHDDGEKLVKVEAQGWPLTLQSVDRWKSVLDGLAGGMDRVVGGHLKLVFGTSPW
jgi:hypothetical protein